jgi:hypothetical protein
MNQRPEAERERRTRIISADVECQASTKLAQTTTVTAEANDAMFAIFFQKS